MATSQIYKPFGDTLRLLQTKGSLILILIWFNGTSAHMGHLGVKMVQFVKCSAVRNSSPKLLTSKTSVSDMKILCTVDQDVFHCQIILTRDTDWVG